jgi:hypothetical protein
LHAHRARVVHSLSTCFVRAGRTIRSQLLLLALGAVLRSPVRRHVRLPATAEA